MSKRDTLDKTVTYLQKRDGIDKVLKIIRYTSRLLLVSALADSKTEFAGRLSEFEKSIGTSRKAYRLGKFLQDVSALRKAPLTTLHGLLECVSSVGEGLYYFIDQFIWLSKAGLLPINKRLSARLTKASAYAEAGGYVASITLNCLRIAALLEREHALLSDLCRRSERDVYEGAPAILAEIGLLRERRTLRTLAVIQDGADMLLALNDIKDGQGRLSHPALLALAGLLSACLSAYKNWKALGP